MVMKEEDGVTIGNDTLRESSPLAYDGIVGIAISIGGHLTILYGENDPFIFLLRDLVKLLITDSESLDFPDSRSSLYD